MPPETLRLEPRTCVRAAGPEILRFGGRCGRMGVCGCVCTFGFRGQETPQCLRAVRLRPDSIVIRMQSYAPYALPLKGKRPKKVQLPKEVHKVHTASCMYSQPYSRLASCLRAKSAYGPHTAAYGSHRNQALALLPVGIGASSARENRKCIRRCIRLFRHATPYRPPIGNGRRNRPDDPAPGRDGISTDSTHPPIPVGIVAGHLPQGGPYMPFFGPSGGLSPQEAGDQRASPPSALRGRLSGAGRIAREKEAIRRGLAA